MTIEKRAVRTDDDGLRVDRWLKKNYPALPHTLVQKLVRTGQVRVDGGRVKADSRLSAGQEVRVPTHFAEPENAPQPSLKPPPGLSKADRDFIERMIVFENDEMFILNKPFGIAVQGGTKTTRHIDGLLAGMADRFGGERPRLVHRLDRDTTGILVVAKDRQTAARLGRLFQTRSVQKIYWAITRGIPKPPQGKVEAALVKAAGPEGDRVRKARPGEQDLAQHATTFYSVIDRAANMAWVSLKPVTGRQHQLRAHMDILGTPILGDQKYGDGTEIPIEGIERKLHLHARRLTLKDPKLGEIDISAPLPSHIAQTFELLGFDSARYGE
ncbi:RluA family pseudouridine synthase [Rhodomicrobium lacus]|uniref:RluA family pseudouridine synthase n=1 Tax=Rhodomicrobium TaxID=1068 RepID=UPI000F8DA16F|nr:RluA family pseudouridine synthase [Rhodomicrobium lacus]WKW52316.1 RluA family pseudouridine synthase [Rhodomicrobium lacus]